VHRQDFAYHLPAELIAQEPPAERSGGRLLVLDGMTGALLDRAIRDLAAQLRAGDLLVVNDTQVIAARLHGNKPSGGRVEILLERPLAGGQALAQLSASKPIRAGLEVATAGGMVRVLAREAELWRIELPSPAVEFFERFGEVPLPPYIHRPPQPADRERYQCITLHVGAGTFQPLRSDDVAAHLLHPERASVGAATCAAINATRAGGGRVVAVGTTVVRALESAALAAGEAHAPSPGNGKPGQALALAPWQGETRLFITPGFRFRVCDVLLTNFHLPESTLLMLVCAFAGKRAVLEAYAHAVRTRYRFFSYGDAMLVTRAGSA